MHEYFMKKALEIAQLGFVSPNPRVGAILVRDNIIITEAYHKQYGSHHAEVNLFNSLPDNFDFKDCSLYITLEPCSHFGRTPPCVDLVISKGIKKVIIASLDPNPLVSGRGIQKLKDAGIEVITGILEDQEKTLNEAFFKFITTKMPFIHVKSGVSLDGKICTSTGESKWITSEKSRQYAHMLRSQYSAIMVGINTVLMDNPLLTSRIKNGRDPIRIILDTKLKTPLDSKIIQTASKIRTIIVTSKDSNYTDYINNHIEIITTPLKNNKIDLEYLINILANMGIDSILIEGGGELIYSAFETKVVDKLSLYIAPILLGGKNSKSFIGGEGISNLKDAIQIENWTITQLSKDILIESYIKK